MATHEMDFAKEVSDQVVFLDQGVICEQSHPRELFDNPTQPRTKEFLTRFRNR